MSIRPIPTDNFVRNNVIHNSDVRNNNGTPDIRGLKIPKVGHVTPLRPPLTKFCILLVSAPGDLGYIITIIIIIIIYRFLERHKSLGYRGAMHAIFEVSSFNRSREMQGVPEF